jgi:hypothetical protein
MTPMNRPGLFLSVLSLALATPVTLPAAAAPFTVWPAVTPANKPWTRWWWPGNAADNPGLTAQLTQFASAGLGGVEITPIYGAVGAEARYVDFLSPAWMQLLAHTGREARRLGLGVDMATGTGWPFGGPWVTATDSNSKLILQDGRLAGEPTRMLVKRAGPGGEGLVIDPYSTDALRRYLEPFDRAFQDFPAGFIRGQFHDSFEYYDASWTPTLPRVFREMHGYDVQVFAAELMDRKPMDADRLGRLKSDYRQTLARLHLDYLRTWVDWSHAHGWVVRNQSHGAPGNLLDLYANADIAETEVFGSTPFPIPGLRRLDDEVRHDQDLPEDLVIRMASSAAHVAGHNLASSETATWLREHWKVSLAYTKPELDRLFTDGINHIFYHGTAYSPPDAAWPGWLFYASTEFYPTNTWWDDFSALNGYVTRVQSVLQSGRPDNEILLYWPFADGLDDPAGQMKQFAVHDVKWLTEQPVGRLARELVTGGYAFDYISDSQLAETKTLRGALVTPGGSYRVLLVPATRRMPVETLRRIVTLARGGATIRFYGLPEDVPGLGRLAERRAEFQQLLDEARGLAAKRGSTLQVAAPDPAGAVARGELPAALGVAREPVAATGLGFVRRARPDGTDYFLANLTANEVHGWITLGRAARAMVLFDPLTGRRGLAAGRAGGAGKAQVYLQLKPGESVILRTGTGAVTSNLPSWPYRVPDGAPIELRGPWSVEFIKGGPDLPPAFTTPELKSWTDLGGPAAQRFSGTARYRLEFDAPAARAEDWLLTLGDVRESARVRLNGREVATAWSLPFAVRVGEFLRPERNVLELEVTNLAANRIRDLDQRQVPWRIMREINFVDINYKPFDAANWPLTPSGLLGPVMLVPLRVPGL